MSADESIESRILDVQRVTMAGTTFDAYASIQVIRIDVKKSPNDDAVVLLFSASSARRMLRVLEAQLALDQSGVET